MLRGPAGLAVFSCGIRLTPLEAVIDGCSLPKTQRNQALVLLVNKWSIQERYQFSHMLLLGPFRTTHSYFDNSVSICPTSVSHYKWTLSKHTSVHAKCYLLGRSFIAESDHKPLEMIAMKNLANAPPHLQRMLLVLQRYNVTIKY